MRTGDVLRRAGLRVSEEDFAAALEGVLDELAAGAPRPAEPRRSLTPDEAGRLAAGGLDLDPLGDDEEDPLLPVAAAAAGLLVDALSVRQAAERLQRDDSRVRHMLRDRSLLGVKRAGSWALPAFQFEGHDVLAGLPEVLRALPADLHVVAAWQFLSGPAPELVLQGRDCSPLEWLRSGGDPTPVVELAATL